jgi:hypothetical protein
MAAARIALTYLMSCPYIITVSSLVVAWNNIGSPAMFSSEAGLPETETILALIGTNSDMQIPSHTDIQITTVSLFFFLLSPGSSSCSEALMTLTTMAPSVQAAGGQVKIYAPSGYGASLFFLATGNVQYWRQHHGQKTVVIKAILLPPL